MPLPEALIAHGTLELVLALPSVALVDVLTLVMRPHVVDQVTSHPEADVALVFSDKIFPSFVISELLLPNIPTEPVPFNSIFPVVAAFVTVAVSANIPTVSSPSDVIFLLFVTTTSAFAAVPFLA